MLQNKKSIICMFELMEEIWKDIKDLEGYYQISNTGKLKSLSREVESKNSGIRITEDRILMGSEESNSIYFRLSNGLIKKRCNGKDLVAESFLEIPNKFSSEFYKVYYKDVFTFTDFSVNNIEYRVNSSALRVYDYEGNFLSDYPTAKIAEENLKIGSISTSISSVFNGTSLHCYGLQFRRLTEFTTIYKLPSLYDVERPDTVPVAKYFNNRLICVYNSVSEAAFKNNILPVDIGYILDGNTKFNCFTYKRIE
jgi:hypothetical protein